MFGIDDAIVATVGSNLIGGLISSEGQADTNAANAEQAQKQMDFQERMSNTSYQRGMADMRAAGLNPMLAFMKGGASTPSGSMATFQNEAAPLGAAISESMPRAIQMQNVQATTAKTIAEANAANAQAGLYSAQTAETQERIPTYAPNIEKAKAETALAIQNANLSTAQIKEIAAKIDNLSSQNALNAANVTKALEDANVLRASIPEIAARIVNLGTQSAKNRAETVNIKAELPFIKVKSDYSDLMNLPQTFAGSAAQVGGWIGNKAADIVDSVTKHVRDFSAGQAAVDSKPKHSRFK